MTMQAALDALSSLLGNRLSRSKSDLDLHGRSEAWFAPAPPAAVAYPRNTAEVSAILKLCHAHGMPVVAFGRGTSLEGQTLAGPQMLTLDFRDMAQVLQINDADMDVVIQPGVTREALNTELRATGLMFPVDPGADATLGGMAMTRASGTTAVRYGTMRDNVLALEVVLADGRIIRTGTRARKSSAGYDLTGLFVGSEGTLGIVTELTLRLHGQPEAVSAAICAFDTLETAVNAVIDTIQLGLPMARIEFIDPLAARAINAYAGADFPEKPHLLVEFHGAEAGVAQTAATFGEIARDHGALDFKWATDADERRALWTMRHNAYYACLNLKPGARAITTDICVPISRLAQAVEETAADIRDSGLLGPIVGHVGDGNFHSLLLIENDADMIRAKEVAARMSERALALGGTVTGEHGIGIGKKSYMPAEHGEAWAVMGALKAALDPTGLLNPAKLVP
ncbi:putative FAD-linked oxidoreductase [Aquimixticola soesokkakensis]|uniref:D-lactate dehydrogenase (cytochrome) n=1 Tax=Aquimixticola soesokkakensis TaxID=1519096 RepID=A0A1Y5SD23_9RHOB|nr:FAD-linked oxidase C-terminal domain-containing protein [Aquimixticola soesokkakensis]SLN35172.1 putative FAD-linked oxidoreductase [Aquimixticola soesokkakensis]